VDHTFPEVAVSATGESNSGNPFWLAGAAASIGLLAIGLAALATIIRIPCLWLGVLELTCALLTALLLTDIRRRRRLRRAMTNLAFFGALARLGVWPNWRIPDRVDWATWYAMSVARQATPTSFPAWPELNGSRLGLLDAVAHQRKSLLAAVKRAQRGRSLAIGYGVLFLLLVAGVALLMSRAAGVAETAVSVLSPLCRRSPSERWAFWSFPKGLAACRRKPQFWRSRMSSRPSPAIKRQTRKASSPMQLGLFTLSADWGQQNSIALLTLGMAIGSLYCSPTKLRLS
jgi:hypothetical protein